MVVFIIINLVSLLFCYLVAKKRQANTTFWVLMALIAGPFAIPFVFLSKPQVKQNNDHD